MPQHSPDYASEKEGDSGDDNQMSSHSSSSETQESYEIERIIAEDEEGGRKIFLVKWKCYEDFRCTWEPRESFDSDETLRDWAKQKRDGDCLPDEYLSTLENRMEEYRDEKERRRRQRQAKRPSQVQEWPPQKLNSLKYVSNDARTSGPKRRQSAISKDTLQLLPTLNRTQDALPQPADFHGIDTAPRARRTKDTNIRRPLNTMNSRAGQNFRSFSYENIFQKKARTEPAPDPSFLKLKPIQLWMNPDHTDTAHNLPPGDTIAVKTKQTQRQWDATVDSEVAVDATEEHKRKTNRYQSTGSFKVDKQRDLIVDATFGDHTVGKLILTGVPSQLKYEMIRTKKSKYELLLNFEQRNILTIDEYRQLCRGMSNEIFAIVSIEPYYHAIEDLASLAAHLEQYSSAALWLPDQEVQSSQMMILYPPKEPWLFVERGFHVLRRSRLHIAIRNQLPLSVSVAPKEDGIATLDPDNSVAHEQDLVAAIMPDPQKPFAQKQITKTLSQPSTKQHQNLVAENAVAVAHETMIPVASSLEGVFPDLTTIGISYDRMTRLIPSGKTRFDRSQARFFLAFTVADELESLRGYLAMRTMPRLIFTSTEYDGWDTFLATLGKTAESVGVILFHKDWTEYSSLPGLAKLLRRDNVNVFNISLRQPISDCTSSHLDRLFPRGQVILFTESSMLTDYVTTLRCLQWFASSVKTKAGGWKLMLRPNVDSFLRKTASLSPPDMQKCLLDMLVLLHTLQPEIGKSPTDPDSILGSVSGDDEDAVSEIVISSSTLAGYEEDPKSVKKITSEGKEALLVNYFAGWALQEARNYRRFVAVTPLVPEAITNCHHIEIFSPKAFLTGISSKKSTAKPS